jgi:hypothetical protein
MDRDLLSRYRFFRGRGWRVGHDAEDALALARAEKRAEDERLVVVWEPEQESYRDVYGDDPPEGVEFFWVAVYPADAVDSYGNVLKGHGADHLASLGFVDNADRGFMRWQEACLLSEALDALDAERDAIATRGAAELASRATLAGNVVQS